MVVVVGSAGAYLYLIDPNNPASPYPQCFLKHTTGLDCPLCGDLRGTFDLLHGKFASAVSHNALIAFILAFLGYSALGWAGRRLGWNLPRLRLNRSMAILLLGVVLAFTVIRNIPGSPLYWLNSSVM